MDLITFVCPECGAENRGPSDWKQFCGNHDLHALPDGTKKDIVEMKPQESVKA